jgi:hypothetical protein
MFLSIGVFSLNGEILLASSPSTFILYIFSHSPMPDDYEGKVFQNNLMAHRILTWEEHIKKFSVI